MSGWAAWEVAAVMAMGVLAVAGRLRAGDWLAPSVFAPLVWLFYMALPLVGAPDYEVHPAALWKIVSLVLMVQLGAMSAEVPGRTAPSLPARTLRFPQTLIDRLLAATSACSLLSLAGTVYLAHLTLGKYDVQRSLDGLLDLGPLLSAERYVDGSNYPTVVRALVAWIYPAALMGGLAYPFAATRRQRLVALSAFVPALMLAVITAVRSGLLFAVVCGTSAYLSVNVCVGAGRYRPFRAKFIAGVVGGVAAAVCFALLIQVLRGGVDQGYDLSATWAHVRSGVFGYLSTFSEWNREGSTEVSWGFYSFAGLFDMFGLRPREIGVYLTSINLGGSDTNIYTAFRGLIEDFSYPGALLVLFAVGFGSGYAYRRSVGGSHRWVVALAGFYAVCIWSHICSLFVYNGLVLAWLCAFAAFAWPDSHLVGVAPSQRAAAASRAWRGMNRVAPRRMALSRTAAQPAKPIA
jgi:oligosaccharide repeat unit polymerase